MPRSFNTAGPCIASRHYMLSPEPRLRRVLDLIEEEKFFTLTAGHQTGKTTAARWLVQHYNQGQRFHCLWIDLQTARENPDPPRAFRTVLNNMKDAVQTQLPALPAPDIEALLTDPSTAVLAYLRQLCAASPRPLVILMDEADCLIGETMISFLTQIRQGYIARTDAPFPAAMALIGRRQVRDYTVSQDERRAISWLGTSSPFNIAAEAAVLPSAFSEAEVVDLLAQHTAETGQSFLPEAVARIHALSCGHPWLVNALADQITGQDLRDRHAAVTPAHVEAARETLILDRRTHIDSLVARLREPRVMRIIEPMLIGGEALGDTLDDDFAYVMGLGIVAKRGGRAEIANPIYKEVIPRALTYARQIQLAQETAWYVRPDGGLDLPRIMAAWQEFWREDGHASVDRQGSYKEAGPHLLLMAFLQRIVNGGGRIEREYALGRGALDLMISWRGERHAIEIKLRRGGQTEARALRQIERYLEEAGLHEGWLVLFDLRKRRSWKEKLSLHKRRRGGRVIWLVGC